MRQVVVLIRGFPGVGKSTLALALARSLGYSCIMKDDIRDIAYNYDQACNRAVKTAFPDSTLRFDSNEVCYDICFNLGLTQLRVGAPGVVFESPLGRVSLGERAVAAFKNARAFCVLVDCYAERSIWEKRLAQRTPHSHKPRNADQIIDHYDNIDYELPECDAHVRIDCARPTDEAVAKVQRVIRSLQIDESGSVSPVVRTRST